MVDSELSIADVESMVRARQGETSQSVVAKEIGVSQSVISRWLGGKSVPTGSARGRIFAWAKSGAVSTASGSDQSPLTARDVRGVRYAAEAMAETLHRLLREARLAEQGDDAERYRDAVRQSAAQSSGTSQRRAAK